MLKPLNPLFDNKIKKHETSNQFVNVRKKPITKEEGRKERCDRKKDVKIPFSEDERKLIKLLAKRKGLDPTPYCTFLIKKGLKEYQEFPKFQYDPKGKPYPVKLESYFHEQLFNYKVKWDCSLKESAYRIVKYMLELERRMML